MNILTSKSILPALKVIIGVIDIFICGCGVVSYVRVEKCSEEDARDHYRAVGERGGRHGRAHLEDRTAPTKVRPHG